MNNWISVEEGIPKLGEKVLVCYVSDDLTPEYFISYRFIKRYFYYAKPDTEEDNIEFGTWDLPEYHYAKRVTHWMPLPEAPHFTACAVWDDDLDGNEVIKCDRCDNILAYKGENVGNFCSHCGAEIII